MANYQNIIPTQLAQAAITTSYVTLYTVPFTSTNGATGAYSTVVTSTTRTYLKDFDVCNTTAASISVYVSIVPSGGTAGSANALFYNIPIPANTIMQWAGAQIMPTSSTLQVKASAVGLTITVSGGEAQ